MMQCPQLGALHIQAKEITSKDERIIDLSRSGISLSSIFFIVGPSCLRTAEIFKAIEYKRMLEVWQTERNE
jgi:hypothetical protein